MEAPKTRKELERRREFLRGAIMFADRNGEDHPRLDRQLEYVEIELEECQEEE